MSADKVVSAQEHADIMNLYAFYNQASDAGDAESFASCFTEDALLTNTHAGYCVEGRAKLIEFKSKDKARRGDVYRRHWNGSIYLTKIDTATIHSRCYLLIFSGKPGQPPEIADAAVYDDVLVNRHGEWKYAKRTVSVDYGTFKAPA
jgi:uncharacterized protein (TIGR02246 family)